MVLGFFFIYVSSFLIRTQTPWDKEGLNTELEAQEIESNEETIEYINETIELGLIWDYINLKSFVIVSLSIGLAVGCIFASIHTFIDKLFFKKFYEETEWLIAFRRGIELSLILLSFVILRLMSGLTIFTAIPIVFIIILIEYYITGFRKKPEQKKKA